MKARRCRGILRLVLKIGVYMRNLVLPLALFASPLVLAAPSLPDGPSPIPMPPLGQDVFPATVSYEGVFQPVAMLQTGLELMGLDQLSDGDSNTTPAWDISIFRARLGIESERENVSFRLLGEFVSDGDSTVWEAESGDTIEIPNEVTGWRYQLRDAYVRLGGEGTLRAGLTSSGLGFREGGGIGVQGKSYETLAEWSGLFEDRFYSIGGHSDVLGSRVSVLGGRGRSGSAAAVGSILLDYNNWIAGVGGGLYGDSVLASGWGAVDVGPLSLNGELLFVDDLAWSVGASYFIGLAGDTFSGLDLLLQARQRANNDDVSGGLEGTSGLVLTHPVDDDLDLNSGFLWTLFVPEVGFDEIVHSAVIDLQLVY